MALCRNNSYKSYATLNFKNKNYFLLLPTPKTMLLDKNISWEAKGYLSFVLFFNEDLDIPDHIVFELLDNFYLEEVQKEEGSNEI